MVSMQQRLFRGGNGIICAVHGVVLYRYLPEGPEENDDKY
jgi:hypothetical protein